MAGWAQRRISPVRSTRECRVQLWNLSSVVPRKRESEQGPLHRNCEHAVRDNLLPRRRQSPGWWSRGGCGCGAAGPCKPSAGPTGRQPGGPDSARAKPARACHCKRVSIFRRRKCEGAPRARSGAAGPQIPTLSCATVCPQTVKAIVNASNCISFHAADGIDRRMRPSC